MKQNKTVIILVIILAVLIGLYFLVDSGVLEPKKEEAPAPAPSENLTVTYYSAPASHIQITEGETTLTFEDGKTGWSSVEYDKYPMSDITLDNIAAVLCRMTATRELDYSKDNVTLFGLDKPTRTVKFTNSNGVNDTLLIGNRNSANGNYYITIEGSKKLYMLGAEYANMLSSDIMSYVLIPELVDYTAETLKSLEICHDGKTYSIDKYNSSNSAHVNILNYLNAMYVSYCHEPYTEDLQQYGLTDAKSYIKVIYTDTGSNKDVEFYLAIGNIYSEDERYYFVTVNDHPNTVYRMFNLNLTRLWELAGV